MSLWVLALPASADQIVLKDGDRVSGTIVKKDGQTITMESKNFGRITIKWDDIESLRTDGPVNVVLSGDRALKGSIVTEQGRLMVSAAGEPVIVTPSDIVALRNNAEQLAYERLLRPGLLDLWVITGSLNIAGVRGNADTSTLTTPINFVRASSTSRTTAYFNSIRSTATIDGVSARTAQAIRGGWGYNRNFSKRLVSNWFNDYEYDRFQSLDLRVVLGSGLGYQAWRGETGRFDLVSGFAWNREEFGPAAPAVAFTRNSVEAYWGDDLSYKLNSRTTLAQSFRMFNNLTNRGQYRVNFDSGATTKVTKWLTWSVSLSDRYLSNPVVGRNSNDFLYSTGFGFSFAR